MHARQPSLLFMLLMMFCLLLPYGAMAESPPPYIDQPHVNHCPQYFPPQCRAGTKLIMDEDRNGCPKPRCEKSTRSCPKYQRPQCKGGQVVMNEDRNGCPKPICVRSPKNCPVYSPPRCDRRTKLIMDEDRNGCPQPKCVRR